MFVWLKITVLDDVYDLVMTKFPEHGIYALPGHAFYPDSTKPCQYIRLCYSQMKPEDVNNVRTVFFNYFNVDLLCNSLNFFSQGLQTIATLIREEAAKKGNKA